MELNVIISLHDFWYWVKPRFSNPIPGLYSFLSGFKNNRYCPPCSWMVGTIFTFSCALLQSSQILPSPGSRKQPHLRHLFHFLIGSPAKCYIIWKKMWLPPESNNGISNPHMLPWLRETAVCNNLYPFFMLPSFLSLDSEYFPTLLRSLHKLDVLPAVL